MSLRDDMILLQAFPVFAAMEPEALQLVAFSAETRFLRANDTLFRRGGLYHYQWTHVGRDAGRGTNYGYSWRDDWRNRTLHRDRLSRHRFGARNDVINADSAQRDAACP